MSGKFQVLDRMLRIMRTETQDRIVIVSNYTQTLDLVTAMCRENNYPALRLDGSTSSAKRQKLVDQFNDHSVDQFVFLLSSKAGGCGLNLVGGNRLILFDPDWNPATDKQAAARVWRDGQRKRVYIYRFLARGTLEEKVYQRQLSKEGLQTRVVDEKCEANKLSSDDLSNLFSLESDTPSDTHDRLRCRRCLRPEGEDSEDEEDEYAKAAAAAVVAAAAEAEAEAKGAAGEEAGAGAGAGAAAGVEAVEPEPESVAAAAAAAGVEDAAAHPSASAVETAVSALESAAAVPSPVPSVASDAPSVHSADGVDGAEEARAGALVLSGCWVGWSLWLSLGMTVLLLFLLLLLLLFQCRCQAPPAWPPPRQHRPQQQRRFQTPTWTRRLLRRSPRS